MTVSHNGDHVVSDYLAVYVWLCMVIKSTRYTNVFLCNVDYEMMKL